MAFFNGYIRSHTLGMDTGLTVVLPFDRAAVPEAECPAIYLLHGHGENADVWTRMTSAERYANAYGVALVMPEVQRSFYTDMAMGLSYFTYVTEELPAACQRLFHQQPQENRFVAGLSMGGYGALKLGLRRPDLFAGCAGFSGCLDISAALLLRRQIPACRGSQSDFRGRSCNKTGGQFVLSGRKDCPSSPKLSCQGNGYLWNGRFSVFP